MTEELQNLNIWRRKHLGKFNEQEASITRWDRHVDEFYGRISKMEKWNEDHKKRFNSHLDNDNFLAEETKKAYKIVEKEIAELREEIQSKMDINPYQSQVLENEKELNELKDEVEVLGNVEDGQWAEMFTLKEVLREFIKYIEHQDTSDLSFLLEKLDGKKKVEKTDALDSMVHALYPLIKDSDGKKEKFKLPALFKDSGDEKSGGVAVRAIAEKNKGSPLTDSKLPEPKSYSQIWFEQGYKKASSEFVEDLNEIYRMAFESTIDDNRTYEILQKWEEKLK